MRSVGRGIDQSGRGTLPSAGCQMDEIPKVGFIFERSFRIEDILGDGGVGTVFKAVDLHCGRTVALKTLQQHSGMDQVQRSRFLREAKALSSLQHDNIVTVYRFGISSVGWPYLSMEYVEGRSIRSTLASVGRMPVLSSLSIISDVARALAYVHRQGIVHRDIKPDNILLTSNAEVDTVKIVDFGLASLTRTSASGEALGRDATITEVGEIVGTPAYMAPEQIHGESVDLRADIYSLAASLYEMMAGTRPFEAASIYELYRKHTNESVPALKPSQVDQFHPELNVILSKGMAKKPGNRFRDMDEMADKIDDVIKQIASGKKLPGMPVAAMATVATALVVLCVEGLVFTGTKLFSPTNSNIESSGNATFKQGLALNIPRMLDHAKEYQASGKYADAESLYQQAWNTANSQFGRNHLSAAAIESLLGRNYLKQGRYSEARRLQEHALAVALKQNCDKDYLSNCYSDLAENYRLQNKYSDAETLDRAAVLNAVANRASKLARLADDYRGERKSLEAEKCYTKALEIHQQSNDPLIAFDLCGLANSYVDQRKYSDAQAAYGRALEIMKQFTDPGEELPRTLTSLAGAYFRQGKYADTEPVCEQLLILHKNFPAAGRDYIQTIHALAKEYDRDGQTNDALSIYRILAKQGQKFLTLEEEKWGHEDPRLRPVLELLADIYLRIGEFTKSEQLYKQLIPMQSSSLGKVEALFSLAEVNRREGKFADAEPIFKKALELAERSLDHEHPLLINTLYQLAENYRSQNKYEIAEPLFKRASELAEHSLDHENLLVIDIHFHLAENYRQQGFHTKAEPLHEQVLKLRQRLLGPHHPVVAHSMYCLAETYYGLGKFPEAESLYKGALLIFQVDSVTYQPQIEVIVSRLQTIRGGCCGGQRQRGGRS